ncbi:MAG: mechanosensitive ion channel domain-containing protein [Candidatus Thorarchaeota archaeon]
MQTEVVNPFVEFIRTFLDTFGLGNYAEVVALIPFLLFLYVIYLIVMRSIKLSFRRVGMPPEAISGVRLMVRLLFFAVGLSSILAATTVFSGTAVITGGAIFGTAIGLAFSKSLSNLVSGLYMLAARPFRVGDYVRIGDTEGIVNDITLNYTRLLLPDLTKKAVPNSKVIDSEVTNFRVRVDELMYERGLEQEKEELQRKSRFRHALVELKDLAKGTEVYRYTFEVPVHKDYSDAKIMKYFDKVGAKYSEKFLESPEVMFWSYSNFGNVYKIAYIVTDPKDILNVGANFQTELAGYHEAMKSS